MSHFRILHQIFFVVFLLISGGCTMLGPDFQTPEADVPAAWSEQDSDFFRKPSQDESIAWWAQFNDSVLDELIQVAYKQNLSLRSAGLRIMEERTDWGNVLNDTASEDK